MAQYEIKDVVCDYGLYEYGELKLILNSSKNADTIKRILEIDGSVPNAATIADFVEVVRCKDCKHYSYGQSIHRYECNIFNGAYEFIGYPTKPNDFCSYGERRTEK